MEKQLQNDIKVKIYDCDENRNMTAFSIFNYMQDIALNNAQSLHFGYDDLYQHNLIWVLSRVRLSMNTIPVWNDTFSLTTRPQGADGLFALRDFVFKNAIGEQIGYANSYWLVLNADTLRPQRISEALGGLNYDISVPDNYPKLSKINISGSEIKTMQHTPHYSEIDLNHHVNNANYTKWTTDIFDYDYLKNHILTDIQINYISAAKYADNLLIKLYDAGGNHFFVECHETDKNTKIYQAELSFAKN